MVFEIASDQRLAILKNLIVALRVYSAIIADCRVSFLGCTVSGLISITIPPLRVYTLRFQSTVHVFLVHSLSPVSHSTYRLVLLWETLMLYNKMPR